MVAPFIGFAAAPPYPPWVSWAVKQGVVKTAGEWDRLPSQVQVALRQKYMEDEAKKLGVLSQQAPPPGGMLGPSPVWATQKELQDQLNSLTAIPVRGTQGPYIPMSGERNAATNRHNNWFAKMSIDPIMLLGLRLRMGEGEPPLPFKFYTSYCNESYVWISYVVDNEMITLKDDAHLFPSDELIATLKLAIEAFSR